MGDSAFEAPAVSVPILKLGDALLVTIQGDLHDQVADQLRHDVIERIADSAAVAVIIDISGVEVVDSFLGRVIAEIAAGAKLIAARTIVAGMRPAVAITLVELGLGLPGVSTVLNVDEALRLAQRERTEPGDAD